MGIFATPASVIVVYSPTESKQCIIQEKYRFF